MKKFDPDKVILALQERIDGFNAATATMHHYANLIDQTITNDRTAREQFALEMIELIAGTIPIIQQIKDHYEYEPPPKNELEDAIHSYRADLIRLKELFTDISSIDPKNPKGLQKAIDIAKNALWLHSFPRAL